MEAPVIPRMMGMCAQGTGECYKTGAHPGVKMPVFPQFEIYIEFETFFLIDGNV